MTTITLVTLSILIIIQAVALVLCKRRNAMLICRNRQLWNCLSSLEATRQAMADEIRQQKTVIEVFQQTYREEQEVERHG